MRYTRPLLMYLTYRSEVFIPTFILITVLCHIYIYIYIYIIRAAVALTSMSCHNIVFKIITQKAVVQICPFCIDFLSDVHMKIYIPVRSAIAAPIDDL